MQAGQDISLTGATLSALGENGSVILSAGNNLILSTDTLEAKKDMTQNADNYLRTYRKTETANTITGGKDITIVSGNDIKARNTTAVAGNGAVTMQAANDVTIKNGYNESTDDYGLKFEVSGFLSSTTTTIKSHDESKTATGSVISGDTVNITSGGNTQVIASDIVGTNDVTITSGKNADITSAEEKEKHNYSKYVEKSGIFGGGGLGIFIGTEERSDQYKDADTTQRGSTIGSIDGNVTIEADKDIHVEASDVIAGKNISMTGENVEIASKDNTYHSDEKHEYKRSGIGVSIGGGAVNAVETVAAPVKRMTEVSNSRLKALYGYKTIEEIKKNEEALKAAANGKFSPTISVSIGNSSSESESHSTNTEAQGSTVQAGQDVNVKVKEDIAVEGSDIIGNNINLEAGKDIHIKAAEENETYNTSQSSQGGSIGVNISAGVVVSVNGNFYSGKDKENGSATGYKGSTVTAMDTLTMKSGQDTDIIGSTVSGNKVNVDVGGNLNIESLQTKKDYNEESTYVGGGFSVGATGKTSYGGSASKGNMDSNYESVSNQAGIYAGEKGFDINVKENTNLKAGVIDSNATPDKNTLATGTLTWEDTENKADYKAGGMGISYASKDKGSELNQRGLTLNVMLTVKDSADSTTKSAVAEGTITIKDKEHQKQDISTLNRDTKNSLNQLQEIFDKTEVQERQELASEFAKLGAEKIGDIAKENNWSADDPRRTLLHGLLGGITASLGGNNILSGAVAEGGMESLQPMLDSFLKDHPDMRENVAAIFGYAAGKLFGGDGEIGAATAWSGTAFNWLTHEQMKEYAAEMESATTEKEQKEITEKWKKINDEQNDTWLESQGTGSYFDLFDGKGVVVKGTSSSSAESSSGEGNAVLDAFNEEVKEQTGEVLTSKGTAWVSANWYEANYDDLSRQEAEKLGGNVGKGVVGILATFSYLKNVEENHQTYSNLKNALKADGFDMMPLFVGVVSSGVLAKQGFVKEFFGGTFSGAAIDYYVDKEKEKLKESEQDNLSDLSNSSKAKNGRM